MACVQTVPSVKVVVEFKGVKLEMDLDEAGELKKILERICGEPTKWHYVYPTYPFFTWGVVNTCGNAIYTLINTSGT